MGEGTECEIGRSGAETVTPGSRWGACRAVLTTDDGVRIEAAHSPCPPEVPGPSDTGPAPAAIVVAHGFTGSLGRPALRRAAQAFARHAAVVTFSFRGHGGSGGHSTVGDREVLDLAAAVRWARALGYAHITTVGFSMGGSVVVRHGALYRPGPEGDGPPSHGATTDGDNGECAGAQVMHGERTVARTGTSESAGGSTGTAAPATPVPVVGAAELARHSAHSDAVVAVSAPARWYYRGTAPMRRLHWVVQRRTGRLVSRYGLKTRIHPEDWDPVPLSPVGAAPLLAPTPLLVVHGDSDPYFPLDHPRSLVAAAGSGTAELWIEPGFGHAENAAGDPLLDRIGDWSRTRCRDATAAGHHGTRKADG